MKVAGVIAEYNPFHNGHAYQLDRVRQLTRCDGICVVMSGDYVQRGIPAITDKYTRTRMALSCGADLVVELPVCNVLSSAENFAHGAIHILSNLGIQYLCFGIESDSPETLAKIADFLNRHDTKGIHFSDGQDNNAFSAALKKNLSAGLSYAKSVSAALTPYFDEDTIESLHFPNNILAVEYMKVLKQIPSANKGSITPVAIKRIGDRYSDIKITNRRFASATALREIFKDMEPVTDNPAAPTDMAFSNLDRVSDAIPADCMALIQNAFGHHFPIFMDDFTDTFNGALYQLLWQHFDLTLFPSVSPALANKIKNNFSGTKRLSDFAMTLKSKDLSYTRICRSIFQILLGITACPAPSYIRVLGFNQTGAKILKEAKSVSRLPVITKTGDYEHLLLSDIHAANIYNSVVFGKYGAVLPDDYRHGIIH